MNKRSFIEGIFFIVIGLVNIIESLRLTFTVRQPGIFDVVGPDHYSMIVGVAFIVAAVAYILTERKKALLTRNPEPNYEESEKKRDSWKVVVIVGILILYAILIPTVGYLLASILFFFLVLKTLEVSSWILNVALSIGLAFIFRLIFESYLGVMFPKGFIGL